jgi:hypothetical protein
VVQRVQRNVEALQTSLDQRSGEPVEQDAVGCQRQIADALDGREHPDKHGQVAPDERLAAGQPHLVDAESREHSHKARDLLEAEDLLPPEPLQALRRHAVRAAEVALVGDRDAHGLDLPAP